MIKRIALILLSCAVLFAFAGCSDNKANEQNGSEQNDAVKVMPLPATDLSTIDDATLPVSFSVSDYNAEENTLAFTAYEMELFDAVELSQLTEGSSIFVEGSEIIVDSVEDEDGSVVINGGVGEENGVTLIPNDGGTYRVQLFDDYATYTQLANFELKIADTMTLNDCFDYNTLPDGVTVSAADLGTYFASLEEGANTFSYQSTTLRFANGEIQSIERIWTP